MNNEAAFLERYLESEITRLQKEVENIKSKYYVNQTIIRDSNYRINDYRNKEDSVFCLLSPITVESTYQSEIDAENAHIQKVNEENMKLVAEIDECEQKIDEIRRQIDIQHNMSAPAVNNDTVDFSDMLVERLDDIDKGFYSNPDNARKMILELKKYIIENKSYSNEMFHVKHKNKNEIN